MMGKLWDIPWFPSPPSRCHFWRSVKASDGDLTMTDPSDKMGKPTLWSAEVLLVSTCFQTFMAFMASSPWNLHGMSMDPGRSSKMMMEKSKGVMYPFSTWGRRITQEGFGDISYPGNGETLEKRGTTPTVLRYFAALWGSAFWVSLWAPMDLN